MTDTTDNALLPCHSCGSRLGPFLSAPDGNQQVICSTCGMRGPYESLVETAAEKWNALAPATDAQATARAEAMQSIATWRKAAHDYDEDVGNDPRDFDVSDVQAMEITAERALNRYRAAREAVRKGTPPALATSA
jgi:hypothetical protein